MSGSLPEVAIDFHPPPSYCPASRDRQKASRESRAVKIRNSLKSAKARDKNNFVVRRKGRLYVLNKKNPRMKTRQG